MTAIPEPRPHIVLVDDDRGSLEHLAGLLERRFGADYLVVAESSPPRALELIGELVQGGAEVCLVLADRAMPEMSGVQMLRQCATVAPNAKRVVLLGLGELNAARREILGAAAIGEIETYIVKPMLEPDEAFYRAVSSIIADWHFVQRPQFEQLRVVGDRWDPDVHRIVASLERSGIHVGFYEAESQAGRDLLAAAEVEGPLPAVIGYDGRWAARPSQAMLADLLGVNDDPTGRDYDVAVVGAGPAGLAAAVYAASEGLSVLVIESDALGGQASTSSMIRNYLGFPRGVTGSDLASRAYAQAWFFGSEFLFGRNTVALNNEGGLRVLTLDDGVRVRSRAVVLACGVAYRRLGIESVEQFVGRGVFYGAPVTEAAGLVGEEVVVVGGGNSSAQSSLYLARYAAKVTLIVRHAQLDEMSAYLVDDIEAHPTIEVRFNSVLSGADGDTRLRSLTVHDNARDVDEVISAAAAFILIGAEPRTDWLPAEVERDERGYILTGHDVVRDLGERRALDYETSMPGVFAAGDVRLGEMKRVAAAVGDGSSAIRFVHEYLALLREA